MIAHPASVKRQRGFLYMEALVATAIIAIALVPAMHALSTGSLEAAVHQSQAIDQYYLQEKMEQLAAEPVSALLAEADRVASATTSTNYTDSVTTADGRTLARMVFLSRYDGDNADADNNPFTGTDAGIVWMHVELAGTTLVLEGLRSIYD